MKKIYIRGVASDSADILAAQLEALGHSIVRSKNQPYDVIVCWGMSTRDPEVRDVPTLNGNVNLFNKFEAMKRFQRVGVQTPIIFPAIEARAEVGMFDFPWLARKVFHEKGKDITLCKTRDKVNSIVRDRAADFFSVYVPHDMELRAWVFGPRVFATYHKVYTNPGLMNFRNLEHHSELREDLLRNRTISEAAIAAVKALKMDFGAVDILRGNNGQYYTLEVNSMPDISSMIRVNGIRLAKNISTWAQNV